MFLPLLMTMTSLLSCSIEGTNPLEKYQWKKRIIIITGETESETLYNLFLKYPDQLEDRDLMLLFVKPNNSAYYPSSLQHEVVEESIINYFSLEKSKSELLLIGKDGGIKWRKGQLPNPNEIFALIDGMPMRKFEMGRKKN